MHGQIKIDNTNTAAEYERFTDDIIEGKVFTRVGTQYITFPAHKKIFAIKWVRATANLDLSTAKRIVEEDFASVDGTYCLPYKLLQETKQPARICIWFLVANDGGIQTLEGNDVGACRTDGLFLTPGFNPGRGKGYLTQKHYEAEYIASLMSSAYDEGFETAAFHNQHKREGKMSDYTNADQVAFNKLIAGKVFSYTGARCVDILPYLKIQTIKWVRATANMGLKEAKELVDSYTNSITNIISLPVEECGKTWFLVKADGAVVEIKGTVLGAKYDNSFVQPGRNLDYGFLCDNRQEADQLAGLMGFAYDAGRHEGYNAAKKNILENIEKW